MVYNINSRGKGDSIMTIFTAPAFTLVGINNWTWQNIIDAINGNGISWWLLQDNKAPEQFVNLIQRPNSINGYTPRNKKLLTYPFLYLGFNSHSGNTKIYRYENFQNATPIFKLISELNPNPDVCIIPQNYKGSTNDNISETAHILGYPSLGWISDYYNTWLAQNGAIMDLSFKQLDSNLQIENLKNRFNAISSAGNAVGSALSGDLGGAVRSLASEATLGFNEAVNIKNWELNTEMLLAQREKQELIPNSATGKGSNATLMGYNKFNQEIFTRYSIKAQFAEIIDSFFDMYGYATNKLKEPNINNRPNWNYIKTSGANILGNIPQEDLQTIKNMFDNGVTLWHNTETFLDYSQNNR